MALINIDLADTNATLERIAESLELLTNIMSESGIVAVVPMPAPTAPPAPVLTPDELVDVVSRQ